MTIIIDDDNTCPQCGAYFEDNGYCVNGHLRDDYSLEDGGTIPLQRKSIGELLTEVQVARADVKHKRELLERAEERLQASKLYEEVENAKSMVRSAEADLEEIESISKIALLIHEEETAETRGFGWQVKNFTIMEYDEDLALEWAKDKPAASGMISLQKRGFEKAAKALIDTGLAEGLQFVTVETEKRAQLTKELG